MVVTTRNGDTVPPRSLSAAKMSRFTRSRTIPEWKLEELTKLVVEIAAVDDEFGTTFSSHQKWEIVADNLFAKDVHRNYPQCRRKWDSLLSEYRAIKDWESRSGTCQPYWRLGVERRRELNLPVGFDPDLFRLMDDLIEKRGRRRECGGGIGEETLIDEGEVEMTDGGERDDVDFVVVDSSGSHGDKDDKGKCVIEKLQEKSSNLLDFVELIEAVVRGELSKNAKTKHSLDLRTPNAREIEFTRLQADELIRVYDDLIATLNTLQ